MEILRYWDVILFLLMIIGGGILKFIRTPSNKQLEQIKKWLLWAVTQCERDLGAGTGKLKLSMVYDMFVSKFTWIAKFLPFVKFSNLVDVALGEMKAILSDNKAAQAIVNGAGNV